MSHGHWVEQYRLLESQTEIERSKWNQFRACLDKKDRKTFDQMYDYVSSYTIRPLMMAYRPVVIHIVLMSILMLDINFSHVA